MTTPLGNIRANRAPHEQADQPVKVADGAAFVEDFILDADGTRYRVVLVDLGIGERIVLAEPVAGRSGPRRWFPHESLNAGELAQSYIGEKLGFLDWRHTDCRTLTILIGYALERPVLVWDASLGYERREP